MQPIKVRDGEAAFQANEAVQRLARGTRLDGLWELGFPIEDMEQLYQLLGYCIDDYLDPDGLPGSRLRPETRAAVEKAALDAKGVTSSTV